MARATDVMSQSPTLLYVGLPLATYLLGELLLQFS
jgi:hypothetical protein